MSAAERAQALRGLLAGLAERIEPLPAEHSGHSPVGSDPLVYQLAFSMLLWETTLVNARSALRRVLDSVVDVNELRVCLPEELAAAMGPRIPHASERAERLRAALRDIYRREQSLSLRHLQELPKRDARAYIESLEGVPPYAAARVALLGLGAHAVPVDERLRGMLEQAGAADPGSSCIECAGSLERQLRANEALDAYLLLEAWRQSGRAGEAAVRQRSRGSRA